MAKLMLLFPAAATFLISLGSNSQNFDFITKDIALDKKSMKILTAKVVTGQKSVLSWVESKLLTHMEEKLEFPRTYEKLIIVVQ